METHPVLRANVKVPQDLVIHGQPFLMDPRSFALLLDVLPVFIDV
jgi:hypothetical protein